MKTPTTHLMMAAEALDVPDAETSDWTRLVENVRTRAEETLADPVLPTWRPAAPAQASLFEVLP